jgi:hypothetical protein
MAETPTINQLTDALSAPVGDLIAAVGSGVAEAQQAMDAGTIANVRALAEAAGPQDPLALLRQIGYQPTWYQIPEVSAEITVALTVSGGGSNQGRIKLMAAPVDASYSNRYNYELKAASIVKFKIVPVPPSPKAEQLRVVPTVLGLTYADATQRLDELNIRWQLPDGKTAPAGDRQIVQQSPAPGVLLTGDEIVQIGF